MLDKKWWQQTTEKQTPKFMWNRKLNLGVCTTHWGRTFKNNDSRIIIVYSNLCDIFQFLDTSTPRVMSKKNTALTEKRLFCLKKKRFANNPWVHGTTSLPMATALERTMGPGPPASTTPWLLVLAGWSSIWWCCWMLVDIVDWIPGTTYTNYIISN